MVRLLMNVKHFAPRIPNVQLSTIISHLKSVRSHQIVFRHSQKVQIAIWLHKLKSFRRQLDNVLTKNSREERLRTSRSARVWARQIVSTKLRTVLSTKHQRRLKLIQNHARTKSAQECHQKTALLKSWRWGFSLLPLKCAIYNVAEFHNVKHL